VSKRSDLRVEDVILDSAVSIRSLVTGGVPGGLHLLNQAVLVLLGALLDLLALRRKVRGQLVGVPGVVWTGNIVIPVLLYEVGQLLAVGSLWERNVVVRQPSLELGLVPLVVG